jgi:GntR family transcriptional regulator
VEALTLETGPIPLYHQLERDLQDRIAGGEFSPGDALPTEEQICAQYGVSRITVRRALDALIAHGLIVKKRGVGSFVAQRPDGIRSVRLAGSLDEFLATAGALSVTPLSLETVDVSPAEVVEALGLKPREKAVRLEMISSLSMGPVIYLEVYFPEEIGQALRLEDVRAGTPVIRIIERRLNLRVVRAQQLIESSLAGETAGRHLGLSADTPILRIQRVYYTAGDRPIEVAILRHHPERYQYVIEFRPSH